MVKKDWTDKLISRASVATEDYKAGIADPDRDPILAALEANKKRIANLQKSIADKTWEKTMGKLSQADWQKGAEDKGVDRYGPGVEKSRAKIADFVNKFRPQLEGIQRSVRSMPQETDSQREARMLANLRALKKAKGSWR
ncbi:MAG: hypothetical protein ACXABY_09560 [Candidatus Thorarchaeota archaeon]|jgi:hypothetical protein